MKGSTTVFRGWRGALYLVAGICTAVALTVVNHWKELTIPARPWVALVQTAMRGTSMYVTDYKITHGHYPRPASGRQYTVVTELTSQPLQLEQFLASETEESPYKGPPIDPFRKDIIFEPEKKARVWFCDGHNSEFRCWYEGYSLRYYYDGTTPPIFLSDGPDRDADITEVVIRKISTEKIDMLYTRLRPYTYDATNGTYSDGDLYLVHDFE